MLLLLLGQIALVQPQVLHLNLSVSSTEEARYPLSLGIRTVRPNIMINGHDKEPTVFHFGSKCVDHAPFNV